MGADDEYNVGRDVFPAFPYEKNAHRPAVLVGAIVDPVTNEVVGYLPLAVADQGDGTCILLVRETP